MWLLYIGYIWLTIYRLKRSPMLSKKLFLTQEDINNISQLGKWTSNFETMFMLLFIIAMIISCYRKNIKAIIRFIAVNIPLFIGIFVVGYILFLITASPIGNLLEPLFLPIFLMGGLLIYMLWLLIKKRKLVE